MEPMRDFAQLQLSLRGSDQWLRIDPSSGAICRGHGDTRGQDTHTPPTPCAPSRVASTNRACWGCYPAPSRWCPRGRAPHVPEVVRRTGPAQGLYADFHYRELARILFATLHYRIDHKTVKQLWQQIPVAPSPQLELWDYHTHPDRVQARWQAIQLYYQGWHKVSISRFLRMSHGPVDLWIARFEEEHMAGLVDHKLGLNRRGRCGFPPW